jgi:3alpha(or 20beta)-hydroxysteroid dehydrogenase
MPGRLDGKVALISGGARGMGASEARLFVGEGARVLIGDVLDAEGEALAKELGDACTYRRLDVTSEADWQAAVSQLKDDWGRLDVLVNNAGILRTGLIEHTSVDDFEGVMRVNLTGTFLGIKSSIAAMRESGGGSIVNISSLAGVSGVAGIPAYVSSKYAIRGLTKAAALELGRQGIRVNSVHPGGVATAMTGSGVIGESDVEATYGAFPISRIGQPEEVANMVLFLASDESAYCTGAEYLVDGGAMAGRLAEPLG